MRPFEKVCDTHINHGLLHSHLATLETVMVVVCSQPSRYAQCLFASVAPANPDLTTLKYVEPANAFGGQEEPKLVTTTVKEYDIKQVNSAIRGVFTGIAMMGFMHIYMKYTNPLLLQSIMPIKSAIEQNIVQIHVFGKPAIGDLKRPFKAASMFGGAGMGGGDIKTDKKTISAAETAGAGGFKEE